MGRINCRRMSSFLSIKLMIMAVCAVGLILIVVKHKRLKFVKRSIWTLKGQESRKNNASDKMRIEIQNNLTTNLSWYFSNGKILPEKSIDAPKVFPEDEEGDRIINQLMYIPPDYQGNNSSMKIILDRSQVYPFPDNPFTGCPVDRCATVSEGTASKIHAVLFKGTSAQYILLQRHQVGILYNIECPLSINGWYKSWSGINWTATYRSDSDLVAPYERWVYYDPNVTQILQTRDYAASKSKKVAWFVSNCFANNDRLQYAQELAKHIQVDVYGVCGPLKCHRKVHKQCLQLLDTDYKFYLAFENSNCIEYITEKFYVNGLGANVLPIVMGAPREDYLLSAPANSYLHVDDFDDPRDLAHYLHHLDQDDELYNSYFRWKGTGEFINTFFWCRLCAMLHGSFEPRSHTNFQKWWNGKQVCRSDSWKN